MSTAEQQAWGAVYRFSGMADARLDGALRAECGMTLAEHELLAVLDAHGGELRMGELARALMLSKSGTTRLVAKLEGQNSWVERTLRPADRRAIWAALTPLGAKALAAARPVYRAAVTALFAGRVPEAELAALARTLEGLIADHGWSAEPGSCAEGFAPPED